MSAAPSMIPTVITVKMTSAPSSIPSDAPTPKTDSNFNQSWAQENKGAIAGIVIGAILLGLLFLRMMTRRRRAEKSPTYTQPPFPIPDPEDSPTFQYENQIDDSSEAVEVLHHGRAY